MSTIEQALTLAETAEKDLKKRLAELRKLKKRSDEEDKEFKVLTDVNYAKACTEGAPHENRAHSGRCPNCKQIHHIERTIPACKKLLALHTTISQSVQDVEEKDGKMLGVLICKDENGQERVLQAYSGASNSIVNAYGSWTQGSDRVPPDVPDHFENFLPADNQKSRRDFNPDKDEVDNTVGNCAAQKLLYYVAHYNHTEKKRKADEIRARLKAPQDELAEVEKSYDTATPEKLATLLQKQAKDLQGTKCSDTTNVVADLQSVDQMRQARGHTAAMDCLKLTEYYKDAAKKVRDVEQEVKRDLEKLDKNPPRLVPIGLAECWIGKDTGTRKNGEICDSCLTCHNTLGYVLCGLKEMQ